MKSDRKSNAQEKSRRSFIFSAAAAAAAAAAGAVGATALPGASTAAAGQEAANSTAEHAAAGIFSGLRPLGDRVHPITAEEFQARLVRAQELMGRLEPKMEALLIGPGTSLYYFTGIHWYLSERLLALVVPRSGQAILVSPGFEVGRMRESMRYPLEVRVWQEDESPTKAIAGALADRGIRTGRVGIEERMPFTFYEHFRAAGPAYETVSADPVTIGCRAVKSAHELELMRLACAATIEVYRVVFANLKEGMSQDAIGDMVLTGFAKMDLRGEALVLLGASAALPHGSKLLQKLKEGDVVLVDGGCTVDGYQSDITRTGIFGKASAKIQGAFETVRKAQDAALEAARAGKLSGSVDDAARAVVTAGGFGPGYKYFTHRLGHGIGLDGHEHPYLVRGSTTVLEAGMTFSNEPGIYVPGEFGVRCEDDMVIMAEGPAQILSPRLQVSLEKPLG
jgi:Xaa-Pro dipeptidase